MMGIIRRCGGNRERRRGVNRGQGYRDGLGVCDSMKIDLVLFSGYLLQELETITPVVVKSCVHITIGNISYFWNNNLDQMLKLIPYNAP